MGARVALTLALIVLASSPAQPFPTGAPSQACSDLRPQHGGTPQTSTSPYELDVEIFADIPIPNEDLTYSYTPTTTYERKKI